jgi:hypothetical protein
LAINPPRVGDFTSEQFPSVQELYPLVDGGWVELAQLRTFFSVSFQVGGSMSSPSKLPSVFLSAIYHQKFN